MATSIEVGEFASIQELAEAVGLVELHVSHHFRLRVGTR
jgi:hypothetical protein